MKGKKDKIAAATAAAILAAACLPLTACAGARRGVVALAEDVEAHYAQVETNAAKIAALESEVAETATALQANIDSLAAATAEEILAASETNSAAIAAATNAVADNLAGRIGATAKAATNYTDAATNATLTAAQKYTDAATNALADAFQSKWTYGFDSFHDMFDYYSREWGGKEYTWATRISMLESETNTIAQSASDIAGMQSELHYLNMYAWDIANIAYTNEVNIASATNALAELEARVAALEAAAKSDAATEEE